MSVAHAPFAPTDVRPLGGEHIIFKHKSTSPPNATGDVSEYATKQKQGIYKLRANDQGLWRSQRSVILINI